MYEYFEGKISSVEPARVVIDVAGIGYILQISNYSISKLPKIGERAKIFAHLAVTDGEPRLFGFADSAERDLFRLLTSVSGVGPSTALQILSNLSPPEVLKALASSDEGTLRKVKGVGAKTASRLVVDLKDAAQRLGFVTSQASPEVADAQQALEALGFTRIEVQRLIDAAQKQLGEASSEELIKAALAASRTRK